MAKLLTISEILLAFVSKHVERKNGMHAKRKLIETLTCQFVNIIILQFGNSIFNILRKHSFLSAPVLKYEVYFCCYGWILMGATSYDCYS